MDLARHRSPSQQVSLPNVLEDMTNKSSNSTMPVEPAVAIGSPKADGFLATDLIHLDINSQDGASDLGQTLSKSTRTINSISSGADKQNGVSSAGQPSSNSTTSAKNIASTLEIMALMKKAKLKKKVSSTSQPSLYNSHALDNNASANHNNTSMNDSKSLHLPPVVLTVAQEAELVQHSQYLGDFNKENESTREAETRTAPLFVGGVLTRVPEIYPQYGLLAKYLPSSSTGSQQMWDAALGLDTDPRVLLNVGAPWSAFICGQQGSGKSHSLSCILENCLISSSASHLPKPLSGMIFHWDRYTGYSSHQICEAAYLATAGIPVRVLCSPSNLNRMKAAYENIPELKNSPNKPVVLPLLFRDTQLNVKRMMTMMGVRTEEDSPPLYVEVILRILRDMAQENQEKHHDGLNYEEFRTRLATEQFTGQQNGPLKLRLDLLESFLRTNAPSHFPQSTPHAQPPVRPQPPPQQPRNAQGRKIYEKHNPMADIKPLKKLTPFESLQLHDAWKFNPGTLTIVDLSCPFVDENAACALFSICLELFLDDRSSTGRIIALDEAHKFLTGSSGAVGFTEELLQVIRQQRHLGTRVVIATQEPTISPRLLELCNFTIVHRFQSPSWFKALQSHLAGASSIFSDENNELGIFSSGKRVADLFDQIVNLSCGRALLFAPSAIIGFVLTPDGQEVRSVKLGPKTLRIVTRQRLTTDGGRSIMAE